MSTSNAKMRAAVERIAPRERKRLRRNVIMWQGRLDRAKDSLRFEREIRREERRTGKVDDMFPYDAERAKELEASVEECRERLQRAEAEVRAAFAQASKEASR